LRRAFEAPLKAFDLLIFAKFFQVCVGPLEQVIDRQQRHCCRSSARNLDRVASSETDDVMISITVRCHTEGKWLTVDPAQGVHEVIAESFGCQTQKEVQRVLSGDTDVLEGESFEITAEWITCSQQPC